VTINAAINIQPFDANIFFMGASISPPFRWSKESDDRRPRCNGEVGGSSISAYVDLSVSS
jgi:hypothetical protein